MVEIIGIVIEHQNEHIAVYGHDGCLYRFFVGEKYADLTGELVRYRWDGKQQLLTFPDINEDIC